MPLVEHSNCDPTWCRFHQDPLGYTHHELPYGKDLHGKALKEALESIMNEYTTDIVLTKLAPCLNSQRNESLNGTIGSKNPKIRYYGGSESSDFRIACGVAQRNEGHQYISKTLESLGITPGHYCCTYHTNLDKKQENDNIRKAKPEFKIKRRKLFQDKCSKQAKKELKENATYQSNIGLNLDPSSSTSSHKKGKENEDLSVLDDIDSNKAESVLKDCEALIGNVVTRPEPVQTKFFEDNYYYSLIFDTETTTIRKSAQPIPIAATTVDEQNMFSEYIQPKIRITQAASNIHGIKSSNLKGETVLFKDGKQLSRKTHVECLQNSITFIETTEEMCKQKTNKPFIETVLIGHNASAFDVPTLLRTSPSTFNERLKSLKIIFADSLVHIKQLRSSGINSTLFGKLSDNKLSALYSGLFKKEFNAHDALEDVKALSKVLFHSSLQISIEQILQHG